MILAIDPAIATLGWSVIQPKPFRVLALGVLPTAKVDGVDKSVGNARRIAWLGRALATRHRAWGCTTIAAEQALSFGNVHIVVPQAMCWGMLAHLANEQNAELLEVVSKEWQEAVVPGFSALPKTQRYPRVLKELSVFIGDQLLAVDEGLRTHAVDAVAVGMFAALQRRHCRTVIRRHEVNNAPHDAAEGAGA